MAAQLGDSIVDIINESHIAESSRVYSPEIDLNEVDRNPRVYLRSSVTETPTEAPLHSRGHRFIDSSYDLLLAVRVDGSDIADVDDAVGLYEDIDQYIYEHGKLIVIEKTGVTAQWVSSQIDNAINVENLRSSKLVQISGQMIYRYSR